MEPLLDRDRELAELGRRLAAIAERLWVTQRTVETHLTHAFQKLGIRSRAELAAALEPEGRYRLVSFARAFMRQVLEGVSIVASPARRAVDKSTEPPGG